MKAWACGEDGRVAAGNFYVIVYFYTAVITDLSRYINLLIMGTVVVDQLLKMLVAWLWPQSFRRQ